ncbi:MAG: hemerythrin family protein [Candidatus Scalindua sp.]|jgi:hemerythrin|nr:hemerythrin family protein [Candidatus Scalindua sp.]MDV5165354.1 hemerythrin family protein [Candidatus Scalindua sp.]
MIDQKDRYHMYASLINEDQKKIIGTVDKAIDAKQHQENPNELERVLSHIIKDTVRHFTTEESYMKNLKYPGYHYHKEEHQDFSTKAHAYRKLILESDSKTANEILEYLKKWLVKHFQEADKEYTEYCSKSELK